MQEAYRAKQVTFEAYSLFFRRKDMLVLQGTFLFLFLLVFGLMFGASPLMIAGFTIILIYGLWLQSHAKSLVQILLYSFLWALSSFVVIVAVMVLVVALGFMD